MKKIVVGSRGSRLAVAQTRWLLDKLSAAHPGIRFELKIITTKGDRNQHQALDAIGDKGLFTAELEAELLSGEIQMAVHSMKDMPSTLPKGLCLTVPPVREDPADVLVTPHDAASLDDLPKGAVIGSGSKRRVFQLKALRPDLHTVGIRGNIDTRIRKLFDERLDGIVLAAAGMRRLNVYDAADYHLVPLLPPAFVPAPAQGILAVEIREDNAEVKALMAAICDETARIQMAAERGFLTALDGDCHLPIGAYCEVAGEAVTLHGLYGDTAGTRLARASLAGTREEAAAVGESLARRLRAAVAQPESEVEA
ncbi:hydroxymethylbilane synthase [Pseudoramibacter faecis]|uniref:hydroxymethylbilane synthase n=1 Tax=Pseudoramibacter faecis TaxID=3108534 RepID=UPI002E787617|nr:hydroxymethylbilane synthase [Pseudoramibacter sp. HA2172]